MAAAATPRKTAGSRDPMIIRLCSMGPLLLFHVELKLTEGYVPLPRDQVQRVPRLLQPLPLQLPDALLASAALAHQPGSVQYTQVLGYALPGDA